MLPVAASLLLLSVQAAAPPAPAGRQAIFDRATDAMNANKCEDAVRDFTALEADTTRKTAPAVAGAIAVRKGVCLVRIGRQADGEASLRKGMAALGPLGAAYAEDMRLAHLTLGRIAYADYDYGASERELAAAVALSEGDAKVEPLLLLARTTMFDKDGRALGYADQANALVEADPANAKDLRAAVRTIRARALLNQGDHKAGYAELREALKLQGGLTLKIGLADAGTRGDLALAALLNQDEENARKYLAYTGAGRVRDAPFGRALVMDTPVCGDETGLRPEDSTVIEFGLSENGSVPYASPVYSTGGREAALEFARTVRNWSWTPEAAKAIRPFYRAATRVQLRCSTVGERPDTPDNLRQRSLTWLTSAGAPAFAAPESAARSAIAAKAALDNAQGVARIAPLASLASNPVLPETDRAAHADEALSLAAAANAPVTVRTWLGMAKIGAMPDGYRKPEDVRAAMRKLLADPEAAADPAIANQLRLAIATTGGRKQAGKDSGELLAAIAADGRLAKDDPVRVAALLEQSARAAAVGQIEQARTAFEQTGLDEAQCALIGPRPAMRRTGASSSDFPMEALRWGFEGWVRTEFDIQADGRTAGQRAIISYPPFVFDDAATGVARDARFEATYRPSGGASCSGQQQQIVFQLP